MRFDSRQKSEESQKKVSSLKEQEALTLVDALLRSANQGQRLNDIQSEVFLQTWAGRSYREIAQQ
jgi:uncharacterized membrane protein